MASGDGWVFGPGDRKYWGVFGAAGLLAVDDDSGVLLQHRVAWSHFGDTWGLPGGARREGESAVDAAFREAREEAEVPRDAVDVVFSSVFDLGFWSYTTVAGHVIRPFEARVADVESVALRWVPLDDVDRLPLHPGFASSWPSLHERLRRSGFAHSL